MKVVTPNIPVCRPLLPSRRALDKYLQRIDASRWYTNHGPLADEFEERIAKHFGMPRNLVVSASSGSSALVGAILATAGRATFQKPYCLCPSFTFIATASASIQCGFTPHFTDINERTWGIDPAQILEHPEIEKVGLVIPVAPFGRPIDLQSWAEFHSRSGIPVVIDAAACFDTLFQDDTALPTGIVVAISLHATKAFSTGEGGLILCPDEEVARKCFAALNHGFSGARVSAGDSINGKLSEYHAAVGLASLDEWGRRFLDLKALSNRYKELSIEFGVHNRLITPGNVSTAYMLFNGHNEMECNRVEAAFSKSDITSLRWYGYGLHNQPAYHSCPRDDLPITNDVCSRTLGLPIFVDMSDQQVGAVIQTVASAC